MIVVSTVTQLRAALSALRGGRIGFVPTMGALHEGHRSLLNAARAENDTVVLSIFVNPTQFDEAADLAAYPRTTSDDLESARAAGVDVVFLPDADELYPSGYATTVSVSGPLTETLEGAARGSSHFNGVATVVAKLMVAVVPDTAYFGAKDAQQVVVVRRMVADLGIPVRIAVVPTSRDSDGLARSSRNTRLSVAERARALAVPRALTAVQQAAALGERDIDRLRERAETEFAAVGLVPEYLAFVDPETLEPVATTARPTLVAVAVRVGATRLIDNVVVTADREAAAPDSEHPAAAERTHP